MIRLFNSINLTFYDLTCIEMIKSFQKCYMKRKLITDPLYFSFWYIHVHVSFLSARGSIFLGIFGGLILDRGVATLLHGLDQNITINT